MVAIDITGRAPRPTFFLNEGNFTRNDDFLSDQGPTKGGTYAAQLSEGDEVQIDANDDMTVAVLSTGIPIGRVANRPEVVQLPKENTLYANLIPQQKRIATIEIDGTLTYVKLASTNQAIVPGNYLGVAADKGQYDKEEDTTTNLIALQAVGENAGGYIRAFRKAGGPSQNVAD